MNFKALLSQLRQLFSPPIPPSTPLRVGILISGRGSNMEALIKHAQQQAQPKNIVITTVVSDRPEAPGLTIARNYGIEATYLHPGKFKTKLSGESEAAYIRHLRTKRVDIICLAGFIRVLKAPLLEEFEGRILNVHPSLLPAYPGLDVHRRVLAAGELKTGCTVHFVNAGIDTGSIIEQASLRIRRGETVSSLSQRVLRLEHKVYWKALLKVASQVSTK